MANYKYSYHEERGEFHAYVEDMNGKTVWEVHYPDFYEDEESGELIESSTIFDDGFMKDVDDVEGLEDYLKSLGILHSGDELELEGNYAEGGRFDGGTTLEKVKVTIKDVDMGGDVVYQQDHWFIKDQLDKKTNKQIGDFILKKYGLDYGNTYTYSIKRTGETKERMASGGALETKLKKKLNKSFELPMEMAVYVPSTDKANIIISKRDYASRIEEVERYLSNLFGGYSAVSVDGGYVSDDKGLIQEDVTRVATFGSTEDFESKFNELVNQVVDWCNKWGQESMGFEFEGDMFYINKEASFEEGGMMRMKGVDLSKYENIERIENFYKVGSKWFVDGYKMKHHAQGVGYTKKEALEDLDLHLSYVTESRYDEGGMMARGGEFGIDKHRIYFSTLGEVIDAINDIAYENGYEIVDIFPDLTYGGIGYGQTKKLKVELEWRDGTEKIGKSKKREKNALIVSIYRMDSGSYELNSYFAYADGGIMAKGGNVPTIEKRVEEVNALIKEGNDKGLQVVDTSSTWESPMKYKPFKYSNGVLYEEYEELDLYKYNKGQGTYWVTKKYTTKKSGGGIDDQKATLTQIARMYRKAIKHYNNYGY